MFVWAPLPPGWNDSLNFALDLVARTGVAVAPGAAFGPSGEGWMRLALVAEPADLTNAAMRIVAHRPS
jgi:aspartate/methionine/tyrosine aminotransferase